MVVDLPDDDDAGEEVDLNTWLRVKETFVVKTINGPVQSYNYRKEMGHSW